MSTPNPFAQEEQTQLETMPLWNPETAQPKWYDGLGANEDTAYLGPFYRVLEGAGNGAAKGEAMLAGVWHAEDALGARYLGNVPGLGTYFREKAKGDEEMQQDARDRVRATTPDAATTGTAAQVVHSVVSGAYRATVGSLAGGPLAGAGALGGSEATSRFQELKEQDVDTGTATASAGLAGVTSGVGALLPGGFGSNLISRLLTGVGANVGMGLANRYADHKILEAGGYQDMADQQRVLDGTQMAADAILGVAFGSLAHVHASQEARAEQAHQALLRALPAWGQSAGATDAARALEVALRDRAGAPGVPVDPASAAAHQAALEKAQTDLLSGQRVNVADTGVHDAQFLSRPNPSGALGEEIVGNALREAGVLGEEQSLKDLEDQLAARLRGEKPTSQAPMQTPAEAPTAIPRATFTTAKGSTYEVTENGATIRNKAARPEHPGEFGPQPESERTFYVTPEDAAKLGEFQTQGGPAKSVNLVDQGRAGVRYEEGDSAGKFERRTVVNVQHEPAEGLVPVETWKSGRRVHFGNEITEVHRPESVTSKAGKAADFLAEFDKTHPQNPNEPTERLVNGNTRVELVADPTDPTTAHIQSVRALQTGEGAGTKAMEHIAELADKHNTRLTLQADPLDLAGIGSRKLVAWYKRFGFRIMHHVGEGALMERPPGGASEAALLPEPHELESVGAEHTLDNAYAAALTARAAQLEPDRVWQLAQKHEGDTEGFIREVQAIVDQHEATRAGGEEGAAATGAEPTGERTAGARHAGARESAANAAGPGSTPAGSTADAGAPGRASAAERNDTGQLTTQALADHPSMQIPDETGSLQNANESLRQTDAAAAQGERETPTAITAAIDCFLRKGGG